MNELPDFTSSPEVNIDQSQLVFQAQECGQILTKTLTVTNNIPDSTLKGKWTVYPHQNDPPHTPDDHAFISFSPKYFEGNNIQCQVTVDTSKLQSNKTGERTIILKSNLGLKEYPVKVQIETAPPPEKKKITYWFFIFLGVVFFCSWIFGIVVFSIVYLVPLTINDSMSFYKTYFLMTLFFPPLITLILGIFSGIIVGVFESSNLCSIYSYLDFFNLDCFPIISISFTVCSTVFNFPTLFRNYSGSLSSNLFRNF